MKMESISNKKYHQSEKGRIAFRRANKKYYESHRQIIIERAKRWRLNNPEKVKEASKKGGKKFNQTPKGIFHIMKQNSRRRNMKIDLAKDNFIVWYENQVKVCYYCGRKQKLENGRLEIDRKDNSRGYSLSNIVLACAECNDVKGNLLSEDEMIIIGKLIMSKRI